MAKIEEAIARVEGVDGNRLKLSEKHSRKNPMSSEWSTTGFTNVTAWLPHGYQGPQLQKNDRVKVSAYQRTENRVTDGKTYKNLVWALITVEKITAESESAAQSYAKYPKHQPDVDEEMPF